jgi:hypothetical protein
MSTRGGVRGLWSDRLRNKERVDRLGHGRRFSAGSSICNVILIGLNDMPSHIDLKIVTICVIISNMDNDLTKHIKPVRLNSLPEAML